MSKILQLNAQVRGLKGRKVNQLRQKGVIPSVVYGSGVKDSVNLSIDYKEFERIYSQGGENTLVGLRVDENQAYNVLIHAVDKDPVSDKYIHADFYAVNMSEKIQTMIPLKFEGVSDVIKNLGGVLIKSKDQLEVESLPGDLPSEIIIDVSRLKTFEDVIRVKDIALSGNVVILNESDEAIATIAPPRSEEELKALDEAVEEKVEDVEAARKEEKEKEKEEAAETEEEKK